ISNDETPISEDAKEICDTNYSKTENVKEKPEYIEEVSIEEDTVTPTSKNAPLGEDELVAQILADKDKAIPAILTPRTRKRRHGYETVIFPENLPPTPEIVTCAVDPEPQVVVHSVANISSHNSDNDVNARSSPRWNRTGSEISLTNYENDGDIDSMRSSDTADTVSISSEMSSIVGDGLQSGYHRESNISVRESWHSDVSTDVLRKRMYRIGLNLFNKKPSKGLAFLVEHSFVQNTPPAVASFLLNRKGLSRQMVGEYLGKHTEGF
uniref:SEC7 domain-containing protein n=1 Tax=Ciona savignyi TaxID=51511 RepID=H2ZJJ6_CIOSA